jgi:hypothetical protein
MIQNEKKLKNINIQNEGGGRGSEKVFHEDIYKDSEDIEDFKVPRVEEKKIHIKIKFF